MSGDTKKTKSGVRQCAIADGLELLGERWALLAIREIYWGNHRFGEIQEKTGAPRDILSARLKRLTEEGLIERRRYSERPPRDEYHLTESGRAVEPLLLAIQEWALEYRPRSKKEPPAVLDHHHDHDVDPDTRVFCRVCGERIDAKATAT